MADRAIADAHRLGVVRVRVLDTRGQTLDHGTGWVAGLDTIVTARHVVLDERGGQKGARIVVDVFSHTGGVWALRPHPARWRVAGGGQERPYSEGNDYARLTVVPGSGATPELPPALPLGEAAPGAEAAVFGFALADAVGGASTFGSVSVRDHLDAHGRALIQLSLSSAASIVTAGFSGAPLVVEGEIVGMIVLDPAVLPSSTGPGVSVSGLLNAVPTESMLRAWPDLDPFTTLSAGQALPARPYRYLQPYGPQDAPLFFGRNTEIAQILDWLDDAAAPGLLLLYGAAGTGKSSLLSAGLLPRLRGRVVDYRRWESADAGATSSGLSGAVLPGPVLPGPVLPVLDQAEAAFDAADPQGLARLGRWLDAARGTRAILSFRKEWLAEVTQLLEARGEVARRLLVAPLHRRGVIEVARGPARRAITRKRYDLPYDYLSLSLAERIADDLGRDPGSPVAALLQVLLSRLWDRLPEDRRITATLYEQERESQGALSAFLTRQRQMLAARFPGPCALGLDLDVLEGHVGPHGQAASCTKEDRRRLWGDGAEPLVRALVDHWLLVADGEHTRLAHDTLGPEVRRAWSTSAAPGQRARRLIEARIAAKIGVLSTEDLDFVKRGRDGMRALTPGELELVKQSQKVVDDADRQARVIQMLVKVASVAFGILLLTGVGAGLFGANKAEQARMEKASRYAERAREAFDQGDQPGALAWISSAIAEVEAGRGPTRLLQDTQARRATEAWRIYALHLALRVPIRVGRLRLPEGEGVQWAEWRAGGDAVVLETRTGELALARVDAVGSWLWGLNGREAHWIWPGFDASGLWVGDGRSRWRVPNDSVGCDDKTTRCPEVLALKDPCEGRTWTDRTGVDWCLSGDGGPQRLRRPESEELLPWGTVRADYRERGYGNLVRTLQRASWDLCVAADGVHVCHADAGLVGPPLTLQEHGADFSSIGGVVSTSGHAVALCVTVGDASRLFVGTVDEPLVEWSDSGCSPGWPVWIDDQGEHLVVVHRNGEEPDLDLDALFRSGRTRVLSAPNGRPVWIAGDGQAWVEYEGRITHSDMNRTMSGDGPLLPPGTEAWTILPNGQARILDQRGDLFAVPAVAAAHPWPEGSIGPNPYHGRFSSNGERSVRFGLDFDNTLGLVISGVSGKRSLPELEDQHVQLFADGDGFALAAVQPATDGRPGRLTLLRESEGWIPHSFDWDYGPPAMQLRDGQLRTADQHEWFTWESLDAPPVLKQRAERAPAVGWCGPDELLLANGYAEDFATGARRLVVHDPSDRVPSLRELARACAGDPPALVELSDIALVHMLNIRGQRSMILDPRTLRAVNVSELAGSVRVHDLELDTPLIPEIRFPTAPLAATFVHDGDALRVLTADGEVHELPLSVPLSSGWLVDLGVVLAGRQGVTDAGRDQLIRSSDAEISAALRRLDTALAADDSLGARELRARLVAVGLMGGAAGP